MDGMGIQNIYIHIHTYARICTHIQNKICTIDWCRFYHFIRNSPVALLEALFTRVYIYETCTYWIYIHMWSLWSWHPTQMHMIWGRLYVLFVCSPPSRSRRRSTENPSSFSPDCSRVSSPSSYLIARRIMTALGALQQILFVDLSPPASLLGCSLCLDMLSLSDACPRASIGPPGIGGPRRRWSPRKESWRRRLLPPCCPAWASM